MITTVSVSPATSRIKTYVLIFWQRRRKLLFSFCISDKALTDETPHSTDFLFYFKQKLCINILFIHTFESVGIVIFRLTISRSLKF